ncbi:MAG: hypothetical protein HFE84_04570 [Lachnospiraceae bacterium]|nr:hypothetical protein [Lachnospiraceae bacterium]
MTILSNEAMIALLNRSLTGAALIILVLILRLLLGRFPKRYSCILWMIPFLRLLFSVSIPSPLALLPVNPEPILEAAVQDGRMPFVDTGLFVIDLPVNYALMSAMQPTPAASADPAPIYLFLFARLWLVGCGCFVGVNLFRYFTIKQRLADAFPGEDGVWYTDRISMPMVMGIRKPKAYLPSFLAKEENGREREWVLAHEQSHIRRYDPFMKLVAFAALALHWFNPLVWAAFFLYGQDVEMACDESVLERFGEERCKSYSEALLHFEERRSALFIPLAFGESHTKRRIKHILRYKRPAFWVTLLASVLTGAAAVALLTNPSRASKAGSIGIIGGADGPTAIFLAGKLTENGGSKTAEQLDVETAKKQPYGASVELDYVSAGRISLHGGFGYLAFLLEQGADGKPFAKPVCAVTLSEVGPIQMQGDAYTEIIGGEGIAMIIPAAYTADAPKRLYCYIEEGNVIDDLTFSEQAEELAASGAYRDAKIEDEQVPQLAEQIRKEYGSELVYGPVAVPEYSANVYGFLASDGDRLKDVWYGLWWKEGGKIEKIALFY